MKRYDFLDCFKNLSLALIILEINFIQSCFYPERFKKFSLNMEFKIVLLVM